MIVLGRHTVTIVARNQIFLLKIGRFALLLVRHQKNCVDRQLTEKKRKIWIVELLGADGRRSGLSSYKYDKEKVRETIPEMIISIST